MEALKVAIKKMPFYEGVERLRRVWSEFRFKRQSTTLVKVGRFDILMPSAHPLPALLKTQPHRDQCIGITAKHFGGKYPNAAVLDIGANVGDSAALIATYCTNDLVLVEPSPFFGSYLKQNIEKLPNRSEIEDTFISPEDTIHGQLVHWGGTAFFKTDATSPGLKAKQLSSFNQAICLVKIDTDGNDFGIINGSIDWFKQCSPGIVFEHQIRSLDDLANSDAVFENLALIGYRRFIVFDDPGYLILSTHDIGILKDLSRYLYRMWSEPRSRKSISNYDIVALHERDSDLYEKIISDFGLPGVDSVSENRV